MSNWTIDLQSTSDTSETLFNWINNRDLKQIFDNLGQIVKKK